MIKWVCPRHEVIRSFSRAVRVWYRLPILPSAGTISVVFGIGDGPINTRLNVRSDAWYSKRSAFRDGITEAGRNRLEKVQWIEVNRVSKIESTSCRAMWCHVMPCDAYFMKILYLKTSVQPGQHFPSATSLGAQKVTQAIYSLLLVRFTCYLKYLQWASEWYENLTFPRSLSGCCSSQLYFPSIQALTSQSSGPRSMASLPYTYYNAMQCNTMQPRQNQHNL